MKEQFGTWTPGKVEDIGLMLNMLLQGMEHGGHSIPLDKFGRLQFSVSYIYRPPEFVTDEGDLPPPPLEGTENGFTAMKITYEVPDEGQAQPSSTA